MITAIIDFCRDDQIKKIFSTRAKIVLLCIAAFAIAGCGHPREGKIIQQFRDHRAEFDDLLQMFLSDQDLERITSDFTRPDDLSPLKITPERISQYRRLMKTAGISSGIEGSKPKRKVFFLLSTEGMSISGSGKGIAYLESAPMPPDRLVAKLDAYITETAAKHSEHFTAFQHIEDHWYVYYDN